MKFLNSELIGDPPQEVSVELTGSCLVTEHTASSDSYESSFIDDGSYSPSIESLSSHSSCLVDISELENIAYTLGSDQEE